MESISIMTYSRIETEVEVIATILSHHEDMLIVLGNFTDNEDGSKWIAFGFRKDQLPLYEIQTMWDINRKITFRRYFLCVGKKGE